MRIPDLQEDDYSHMVGLGLLMWIFLVLFIVLSAKIGEPLLSLWDLLPVPILQLHQLCPWRSHRFRTCWLFAAVESAFLRCWVSRT